jgi:hypothetical protein
MFKKIFIAAVIGLAIYALYLTFVPNYHGRMFINEVKETMKIVSANNQHKNVMKRIMRLRDEYFIPIVEEDVELELVDNQWVVKIYWEETVEYFPFYPLYQKTFEFYLDTSE